MAAAERRNDKDNNQEAAPVVRQVGGNARGRRSPTLPADEAFLLEPVYNFDVRTQLSRSPRVCLPLHSSSLLIMIMQPSCGLLRRCSSFQPPGPPGRRLEANQRQ